MNILAVETATSACSVALAAGDDLLVRHRLEPRGHADLLLPWIDELLAECGLAPGRLDAIAFGRGPGSFTSLRLGIGVVQGLAFGADLGVVGISSLASIAQAASDDIGSVSFLVATDARMGQVFTGRYRLGDDRLVTTEENETVCAPERLPLPQSGDWVGLGNGFAAYGSLLRERLGERLSGFDDERWPHAGAIIRLASAAVRKGKLAQPEEALPHYVRDQVATPPLQ